MLALSKASHSGGKWVIRRVQGGEGESYLEALVKENKGGARSVTNRE